MKPTLPNLHYGNLPPPSVPRPRIEPPPKLVSYLESCGVGTNLRDALRLWDTACDWVRQRAPMASDADVIPVAMLYFKSLDRWSFEHGRMEREAMKFAACELADMLIVGEGSDDFA